MALRQPSTAKACDVASAEDGPLPGFGDRLLGLSVGDRASVTITLPADIERRDLAGTEKTYEIEIKELRARKPATINDELAKKGGWERSRGHA